jgi:hypothetical protein
VSLTITRGTSFSFTYQHQHDGTPFTLVGATVYFTAKPVEFDDTYSDNAATIRKDVTTHTDPTNGITTISLTPTDTEYQFGGTVPIEPGDYTCDIRVKEASGAVYKTYEDELTIDGSPTNRSGL